MSVTVYHNPRCSKSRCALEYLTQRNTDFTVVEYFKHTFTKEDLVSLIRQLNIPAMDLIRKNEPEFKEHFRGRALSEQEAIDALLKFPKLIERPIVVKNGKAIVARPTERIEELF
jgi:arsenate reductase